MTTVAVAGALRASVGRGGRAIHAAERRARPTSPQHPEVMLLQRPADLTPEVSRAPAQRGDVLAARADLKLIGGAVMLPDRVCRGALQRLSERPPDRMAAIVDQVSEAARRHAAEAPLSSLCIV
jgi:hypothetical protein